MPQVLLLSRGLINDPVTLVVSPLVPSLGSYKCYVAIFYLTLTDLAPAVECLLTSIAGFMTHAWNEMGMGGPCSSLLPFHKLRETANLVLNR